MENLKKNYMYIDNKHLIKFTNSNVHSYISFLKTSKNVYNSKFILTEKSDFKSLRLSNVFLDDYD